MNRRATCSLGLTVVLGLALVASSPSAAQRIQTEEHALRVEQVLSGLSYPWGMEFLPDGRMLITERPGRLRLVVDGELLSEPVAGLPEIAVNGQGGLLDVRAHPDFAANRLVYFSYAAPGEGGSGTAAARGRLRENRLEDLEVLFSMEPKSDSGRHFGSRLVFDRDGYLYVTLGDRGERERAQQTDDHAGSVIRLHADGRVPDDNPFVGQKGWKPGIFTYGHRNLQGATLHPRTGEVWTHEHGPQGGDEVNIIRAGRNYGWPVITYGVNYVIGTQIGEGTHKPGMEQPLHYWVPSIAPSGMSFYDAARFPRWQGNLFVGALKDRSLVRLVLEGEQVVHEERFLINAIGRIRAVAQGPDGLLYLLTDDDNGGLYRLVPAD